LNGNKIENKINLFALITYFFIILIPLSPIPLLQRKRFKEVRATHFAIPSPKYFAPVSPILFKLGLRFK